MRTDDMEQEQMEWDNGRTGGKKSSSGFSKGVAAGVLGTVSFLCLLSLVLVFVFGKNIYITTPSREEEAGVGVLTKEVQAKINELAGYIHLYFYEDVDNEKLAEGLYSGLLEGMEDKYTDYYNQQEYQDLQISATQNYYGIGAGLTQERDTMQVSINHVYQGSPAETAGLLEGDIIVMVEDIEAVSMELSELVTYIRGEEGTSVHLQIYREGESDYLEFDVARANIDLPTVEYKMLDGNKGYIHIMEFGAPTAEQFEHAVEDLKGQGMEAVILDVRDNPGGMVSSVTKILDDILPEGTVVYTQDKYGSKQEFTSEGETYMEYPLVVLMNGNSASASEILAGAIRDFEYGTLIGTTTYGKGVVQTIYPLKDGDAIKLTTAKYFT
ncbi:MAG: S41 family peptidase, partial [Lachnospiraceae bacterium]|nr:S41 family peptidase [Lachnospiraceae bacterium]